MIYGFKKGNIVISRNTDKFIFHSGSSLYSHAIVVSLDPFILVSEQADMRWSQVSPDDLVVVGTADYKILKRCMRRLHE